MKKQKRAYCYLKIEAGRMIGDECDQKIETCLTAEVDQDIDLAELLDTAVMLEWELENYRSETSFPKP